MCAPGERVALGRLQQNQALPFHPFTGLEYLFQVCFECCRAAGDVAGLSQTLAVGRNNNPQREVSLAVELGRSSLVELD